TRRVPHRGSRRKSERPRPRTPSTRDGTCSAAAGSGTEAACRRAPVAGPATEARSRRLRGTRDAGLLEQLAQGALHSRLTLPGRELPGLRARHHDEVVPFRQALRNGPEGISEQAFYSIALDGTADLPPDRHTKSRLGVVVALPRKRVD